LIVYRSTRDAITAKIQSIKNSYPNFQPHLAIVQAGNRPDSTAYIRSKAKAAGEVGIKYTHVPLPASASVEEVVEHVKRLNADADVSGIIVQLPLGDHISKDGERTVTEAVSPEKDVDGFHAYNIGHLSSRASVPLFSPCTPTAVIRLLEQSGATIKGANAVVLGRSDIVGSPIASMLKNRDATVTICHSQTKDLQSYVKNADIIIAAIGKAEFVKGSWLKAGAVVIDVGINYIPGQSVSQSFQSLSIHSPSL
jgi:methylenetetrahydrofolate dehydrogenase (NADP+)/methenyltetrahydrofolate cyclohydrolase/formyltetrahydrofolate synthetase